MYAEIIFETGSKSVQGPSDEDGVKRFCVEHERRAREGEEGGPTGHPAERISRVILYEDHPGNLHNPRVSVDAIQNLVQGMADKDGTIDHEQLTRALRDEASPLYPVNQGRHESLYKAEGKEMDLSFLKDVS